MVNEVNKLIFNTLVESGAIYIPEVGTLAIERTPAAKSRSRVAGPTLAVAFSSERDGESFANIIATAASISADEADDIVRRWLAKVSSDGKVVIEGVGIIQNNSFSPDTKLTDSLASTHRYVQLTKGKKGSRLPWIIFAVLLLCAACVGAYLYYISRIKSADASIPETTPEQPAPELLVEEPDSVAVPIIDEPEVIEEAVVAQTETEVIIEDTEVVKTAPEEVKAEPEQNTTSVSDWRNEDVHHYVIFGSYSTLNNANVAVRQISRKNPEAQCKVMPLGKMYAVAVYGSKNRKDCEAFKRANSKYYKNAWIHTPKQFR